MALLIAVVAQLASASAVATAPGSSSSLACSCLLHHQSLVVVWQASAVHVLNGVLRVSSVGEIDESESSPFFQVDLLDDAVLFESSLQIVVCGPPAEPSNVDLVLDVQRWRSSVAPWRSASSISVSTAASASVVAGTAAVASSSHL